MPGAKGHLNEDPNAIAGDVTISPAVQRQFERERREERRRRRRAEAHHHSHRRIR